MTYGILIIRKEGWRTVEWNKVKPDTILKNFWRDNHHFADLFNAALFDGEQVLNPDDLSEADTDLSSIIKFNGHAEGVRCCKENCIWTGFCNLGIGESGEDTLCDAIETYDWRCFFLFKRV